MINGLGLDSKTGIVGVVLDMVALVGMDAWDTLSVDKRRLMKLGLLDEIRDSEMEEVVMV